MMGKMLFRGLMNVTYDPGFYHCTPSFLITSLHYFGQSYASLWMCFPIFNTGVILTYISSLHLNCCKILGWKNLLENTRKYFVSLTVRSYTIFWAKNKIRYSKDLLKIYNENFHMGSRRYCILSTLTRMALFCSLAMIHSHSFLTLD